MSRQLTLTSFLSKGGGGEEEFKVEGRVTDAFNPYKAVKEALGEEHEETTIPSPYGAVSLRSWRCGCVVARSALLDFKSGSYYLHDEYRPCREHRWIAEKLRGVAQGIESLLKTEAHHA